MLHWEDDGWTRKLRAVVSVSSTHDGTPDLIMLFARCISVLSCAVKASHNAIVICN